MSEERRKEIAVDDIIKLEKGMHIMANVKAKFIYPNYALPEEMVHVTIEIGKVYSAKPSAEGKVETFDSSIFEGLFKVIDAGGKGRTKMAVYPYHIKCEKTDDPSIKVDFWLNTPYIYPNVPDVEVAEGS